MAKNGNGLDHHQQLRLDYLQKNIYNLTEKEQKELRYLSYIEKYGVPPRRKTPTSKPQVAQMERSKEPTVSDDGLPYYPRNERKKRPKVDKVAQHPKPRKKVSLGKKIKRVLIAFLLLILLAVGSLFFMFFKGLNTSKTAAEKAAAKAEYFNGQDTRDGVNILVLGTDGRAGDSSDQTRTDSIMVVNINNKEGKIKTVSFMRDILVDLDGSTYKLNAAYTFGEQNNHRGAENLRQVLKDNFDIDIKHYALVDFSAFAQGIDTLFPEGVEIDAQFATVNGQKVSQVDVPDDLNMKNGVVPTQTIQVGKQRMDGRTLLNYARFRHDDENDYGRTKRQQQVMAAVMSQAKNPMKLFNGAEAIGKVYSLTSTSMSTGSLLYNGIWGIAKPGSGVESMTVPNDSDWTDAYDIYGGQGIAIDFDKYKDKLAAMGMR